MRSKASKYNKQAIKHVGGVNRLPALSEGYAPEIEKVGYDWGNAELTKEEHAEYLRTVEASE